MFLRVCITSATLLLYFLTLYPSFVFSQEDSEDFPLELPEVRVEEEYEKTKYTLEDATTATKTDTPIEEIPQSIEVIDRDVIDDQRAERLQDIVNNISGMVPGNGGLVPFLVRGFRAEILKDGLNYTSSVFLNMFIEELTNIERVEILKGPSSVLYGNTATGGLINLVTKNPLPDFNAYAEGTIGNYNFYRGEVDISTPINKDKSLLFRIISSYLNSDSFRDFIYSEQVVAAPVMSWQINPGMKLTLKGEYQYIDQPNDFGIVAVGNKPADIPRSRNLAEPTDKTTLKSYLGSATLETTISNNVALQNILRYYSNHGNTFDHEGIGLLEDNRTLLRIIFNSIIKDYIITSQNNLVVNFQSGFIDHKLLFGAEYMWDYLDDKVKFIPSTTIDIFDPVYGSSEIVNPNEIPFLVRRVKTNDLGFYIQDQLSIADKFFILAGLRYDFIYQKFDDNTITPDNSFVEFNNELNEFSPRIGILYEPFKGIAIYGNYSRSFNLLLVNSFRPEGAVLNPEKSDQYEGGVKLDLWGGRLSTTAALFKIIKKNALTPDPLNPIFAIQVNKERSQGFEFDLTAQPFNGLNIIASYAFIDAEVVNDDLFPSGNELPAVPRNSGSVWSTYKIYDGVLNGFGLGAGLIAVGNREGDLLNTFTLGSFIRVDTALYYEREVQGLGLIQASVNFKNITDEKYIVTSDSRVNLVPGAPFGVLANLKVSF